MNDDPILDVRNLTTVFQHENSLTTAVSDVSFTLHPGETLGLVGESGSGKSVTALSILRLIPDPPGKISHGKILFSGSKELKTDLLGLEEKEIRKIRGKDISMIFQEPMTSLNPVFTVGNQVREAILQHLPVNKKEAKERVLELFQEVRLPGPSEIYHSYPHQLSGGQKQRIMIAMAIACNPKILIADEPTTALDVTVQKTILELLKEIQEKHGMSILFITHDLGLVAGFADRVLVMFKGKVVEEGITRDLFAHPRHPYTRGLLSCRPPLDVRLRKLPTIDDFIASVAPPKPLPATLPHPQPLPKKGGASEPHPKPLPFRGGALQSTELFSVGNIVSVEERAEKHRILYAETPILKVNKVKTYFPVNFSLFGAPVGFNRAVDDVTFDVYPGETLGIVGESGCGKTTLGRTILQLVKATSGNITFEGKSLSEMHAHELRSVRKHLQIIFQDPYSSLNPRISCGSAIMEPMKVHRLYNTIEQRKEKAMELLEKVGLNESHFYRYPHEFSGGQRQRICIARALAVNPRVIICDESVSALDVSIQAQVLNLLNDLKETFHFTYLFISHDLSVVRFMSDRLIVMKGGKIEEMGEADSIYSNPQSEYTRRLLAAIPKVK
jgi:peptide/nickel transport system ATP-binding protein